MNYKSENPEGRDSSVLRSEFLLEVSDFEADPWSNERRHATLSYLVKDYVIMCRLDIKNFFWITSCLGLLWESDIEAEVNIKTDLALQANESYKQNIISLIKMCSDAKILS